MPNNGKLQLDLSESGVRVDGKWNPILFFFVHA
jgi:hypothetical protein